MDGRQLKWRPSFCTDPSFIVQQALPLLLLSLHSNPHPPPPQTIVEYIILHPLPDAILLTRKCHCFDENPDQLSLLKGLLVNLKVTF